jgi:bifunctional DNA-binding transcriptional regulator/antitoxin component of YhaV-PrlF toxin-antitoxin module
MDNNSKRIKIQRHYPYSYKITIPKEYCDFLEINDETWINISLDKEGNRIILERKEDGKKTNE